MSTSILKQVLLMAQFGERPVDPNLKTWDQQLLEHYTLDCSVVTGSLSSLDEEKALGRAILESRYRVYAVTPRVLQTPYVALLTALIHDACYESDSTLVLFLEDETNTGFDQTVAEQVKLLQKRLRFDGVTVFELLDQLAVWLNNPRNWVIRDEVWTPFWFAAIYGKWKVVSRNQWEVIKQLYDNYESYKNHDIYDAVFWSSDKPGHYIPSPDLSALTPGFSGPSLREFFVEHGMIVD